MISCKNLCQALVMMLAILAGSVIASGAVQAASPNPLLQTVHENMRATGSGLMKEEVRLKGSWNAVPIGTYNGRTRFAVFAAYAGNDDFVYWAMHIPQGHLVVNGYDCEQVNGQMVPLCYKQFEVDLANKRWRVLIMHKVDKWNVYNMDLVPDDKSYVPMTEVAWKAVMKIVPQDVVNARR